MALQAAVGFLSTAKFIIIDPTGGGKRQWSSPIAACNDVEPVR
jgi:hypothetical protein